MIFAKLLGLTIAGLFCLSLANGAAVHKNSQLSASGILQGLFGNAKAPTKLNSDDELFTFLNNLIFKASTLVLGVGKILSATYYDIDDDRFPIAMPYKWRYSREYCSDDGCQEYDYELSIGGGEDNGGSWPEPTTWIEGATDNNVEINFGHSNFSYRFNVPNFLLESTDFLRLETSKDKEYILEHSGLNMALRNTTLGIQFDFALNNGSFSASNLDLTLEYGEASVEVPRVSVKEEGRDWRDLGPLELDFAAFVNELLKETDESGRTLEQRYEAFMEEKLNDFLAGRN